MLEEEPSVEEPRQPTPLTDAEGALSLQSVQFSYVEGRPVLPNMTLDIPAGQTIAVVGHDRRRQDDAGQAGGAVLRPGRRPDHPGRRRPPALSEDDLRTSVVMVTQENYLFNGSVADNIRFGKPEATREEIVEAAKAIGAHDFIIALPDGYDTDVANRGGRLSAGQRQLVAFARAFLADPAVLILDEATSSLDVPSERLVQRALRTILSRRTAIIIAHRLSTVEIADRVLVMEHGEVVEDGAPQDLIDAGDGRFSDLHDAWLASLA